MTFIYSMALLAVLLSAQAHASSIGGLPSKNEIHVAMQRADDKLKETMKDWICSWTRGVYFVGETARWQSTSNETILRYMVEWANRNKWSPCPDEDHGDPTFGDNQACAATYLNLYDLDPSEHKKSNIEPTLSAFDMQLRNGSDACWWWVDAVFMAGPVWAHAAQLTGDVRYGTKLLRMFNATSGSAYHLWNPSYGLYYRDMRYLGMTFPNGKMYAWGRGNGWAIAALARILEHTSPSDPAFQFWLERYRTMAQSLLPLQNGTDGMWRASLTDPAVVPNPETTASALNTFALAYGLRQGFLSPAKYAGAVLNGWNGLATVA